MSQPYPHTVTEKWRDQPPTDQQKIDALVEGLSKIVDIMDGPRWNEAFVRGQVMAIATDALALAQQGRT